jgi:hypothetical protein
MITLVKFAAQKGSSRILAKPAQDVTGFQRDALATWSPKTRQVF